MLTRSDGDDQKVVWPATTVFLNASPRALGGTVVAGQTNQKDANFQFKF